MKFPVATTTIAALLFSPPPADANVFGERATRRQSRLPEVLRALDQAQSEIDSKLFLYQTPAFQWIPSSVYRYADFRASLDVMATDGVAGKTFYVGEEDVENGHVYGLVNIAAFLAQSMKETIQYDACDENSWDLVGGKYPLSNACGQLGQSYQDYHCSPEEAHMECPVDPNMAITGVTHAKWYGAPAPLSCGPKTAEQPFTGLWDYNYECNKGWANPPESCDVYEGQKAGPFDQSSSYASTGGRTDTEGCCWWGRGVIQTTGVCNFGKLNWYLGAGAKKDGRTAKYPEIDFCKDPEVICSSSQYKELKWIAGEFYWMESVQSYNKGGWDYLTELRKFVEGGMIGTGFIDSVSGIVNRGCHNPPCGTGPVDGGWERAENFKKVLDVLFVSPPPRVASSTVVSFTSDASGGWYPDYNSKFSVGKCLNELPPPKGRPSFDTGEDCCNMAYANQASGVCLSSLSQPTPSSSVLAYASVPGTSLADSYFSSIATHARQRNNFITYNCGSVDIPMDSLVVDILFDYEISVDLTAQPQHLLPDLKKQIMDDLAHTLDCKKSIRRNLRRTSKYKGLLGFHSAEGGDVIDDKKGSCSESTEANDTCIPVIGHLAAFMERNATVDVVIATKDVILNSIQEDMADLGHSNLTQRIVYVSEHIQQHAKTSGLVGSSNKARSTPYAIIILFPITMLGVMAVLLLKRKGDNGGLTSKYVSYEDGSSDDSVHSQDNSYNDSIDFHDSLTSIDIMQSENEGLAIHSEKGTQPITPLRQDLNGTSEPIGHVEALVEDPPGELLTAKYSSGVNSSDDHSYCDSSTNEEYAIDSDEECEFDTAPEGDNGAVVSSNPSLPPLT